MEMGRYIDIVAIYWQCRYYGCRVLSGFSGLANLMVTMWFFNGKMAITRFIQKYSLALECKWVMCYRVSYFGRVGSGHGSVCQTV